MILIAQWFEREGHDECRKANEKVFERCHYVDGANKRWTYGDLVREAKSKFPGQVCTIANTDILFEESINSLVIGPKMMSALTRWDEKSSPRMLGHMYGGKFFSGTQDAWTFLADENVPEPGIRLGVIGCENAFLGEVMKAGFAIFDPALDIRTWHIHPGGSQHEPVGVKGLYVYPELTTVCCSGLVAYHPWPTDKAEIRIRDTWQS